MQQMVDFRGSSSPKVFILARCWSDTQVHIDSQPRVQTDSQRRPNAQIEALKTISAQYPHSIFVAFRIPQLVLTSSFSEIIEQSVRAAVNTVRYPGAPRYMYLARLCTVTNKQSVIFERGVGP